VDENCDKKPVENPKLRIKKRIKKKNGDRRLKSMDVNVNDEITYKIEFGNS
jgi:hypothetical protein